MQINHAIKGGIQQHRNSLDATLLDMARLDLGLDLDGNM